MVEHLVCGSSVIYLGQYYRYFCEGALSILTWRCRDGLPFRYLSSFDHRGSKGQKNNSRIGDRRWLKDSRIDDDDHL